MAAPLGIQARRDSNPHPAVLETAALAIGATGLSELAKPNLDRAPGADSIRRLRFHTGGESNAGASSAPRLGDVFRFLTPPIT